MICTRDSVMDSCSPYPDHIIISLTKDRLNNKLLEYLNDPLMRDMDDYLDEKELAEKIKQIQKDLENGDSSTPEMNSCYCIKLYTTIMD